MKHSRDPIENFQHVYQTLSRYNVEGPLIESLYSEDLVFSDPFHQIDGIDDFKAYCVDLYANVSKCEFDFYQVLADQDSAMLTWEMRYQHKRLNGGKDIVVAGSSHIKFKDGKVHYHRDYFDGGQLLYEHIPLMGGAINFLKNRMAG